MNSSRWRMHIQQSNLRRGGRGGAHLRGEDEDVSGDHPDHAAPKEVHPRLRGGVHIEEPAGYHREPGERQAEAHPAPRE